MGLMQYFQINTMAPPEIMPAKAPQRLERFQNKANNITGPKDAPNPAQAKDTMPNTELSGSRAIKMEIREIAMTEILAIHMEAFVDTLIRKTP